MKPTTSARGFPAIEHPMYPSEKLGLILHASSIIYQKYADAYERPGSSALWIGRDFHLNREEVRELAQYMLAWADGARLGDPLPDPPNA